MEAQEMQGELPSTGSQETTLPLGLTIIPSSPPPQRSPIDISPDSSSHQCSLSSSHPSARLTPATEAPGGIEFLEQTLEMLQAEVAAINNPSPTVASTPLPASTASKPLNNHYRALRTDGWYKYKPEQHVSHIKLRWEDPDQPQYATFLKTEMQAGNPMLLGAMGPGEPVYGRNLNALPFHAAEPRGFTPYAFDVLANPLDLRVNRAVATLGDLGVTADIFRLHQLPLRYLDMARQNAYLAKERGRIDQEQQYLHLAKRQLEIKEEGIKQCLDAARVSLRIAPHLDHDREPGEVPSTLTYPRITTKGARYDTNRPLRGGTPRRGRTPRCATGRHTSRGPDINNPCLYCRSDRHPSFECTQPHARCSAEDCLVPPPHTHFKPRTMCAYFAMHTSGSRMTADEVGYLLADLVYCPEEDDPMTD